MSDTSITSTPPKHHVLTLGLIAAKANVVPAVLLWIVGSSIVMAYYLSPTARPVFDQIAASKQAMGLFYPMLSTALFAGLLPFLMQVFQKQGSKQWSLAYLGYLLLFWAIKGVEIELLYRGQALMFGEGRDLGTLVQKTCFDQFVYITLWGAPTMVFGLLFAQCGFSLTRLRHHLRAGWYRRLVLPVVIPNWVVWIPAVMLIYMLPTVLQLPMQNVVLCLWVLMVMFMTGQQNHAEPHERELSA